MAGLLLLALATMLLSSCRSRVPVPGPTVVVTVPVVQTRLVEVTREVPVTPTPSPTPVYSSPISSPPGVLTYPLDTLPQFVDPQAANTRDEELVVRQLYEGLFDLAVDGSLLPAAAQGYEASADSRVYTVTLRSGLVWSDGAPLSAGDYVSGFCRGLEPAVGGRAAALVNGPAPITGAAAYASGETADCSKLGVTAVNTTTLRISLDAPTAHLPELLTTSLFLPAPPNSGPITQTLILTGTVGAPVNGPFVMAGREPDRIVLRKNERYWNAGAVDIERVELYVLPDLAGQLERFIDGDLQAAGFPPESRAEILARPALGKELRVVHQAGVSYLAFNTGRAPTDNVLVRKAIRHAIDRRRLLDEAVQQPWHRIAAGLIPLGVAPGSDTPPDPLYNPDLARSLLAEAGYGGENPAPVVELRYNREGNNDALFKAIVTMLEEAGIPVRAVSSTWDTYQGALDGCLVAGPPGCPFNLYRAGYILDYGEASSLLRTLSPNSGAQYTGWTSEPYDETLRAAAAEQNEARRTELYRRAEAILLEEEAVVVPLFYYDRSLLVKAGLIAEFPPAGPPRFQYWRLRD